MAPHQLIQKVAAYCWSKNFIDIFRKYFEDHGDKFVDAPEICGGEHNLEYYSLFQDYLKVYENTLTDYLDRIDCTIEELYKEVREAQTESKDPFLKTFIDCLLASADYESFYKVMVREGRKVRASGVKRTPEAEHKAEEKMPERRSSMSKHDMSDNDDDGYKNEGKYGGDRK